MKHSLLFSVVFGLVLSGCGSTPKPAADSAPPATVTDKASEKVTEKTSEKTAEKSPTTGGRFADFAKEESSRKKHAPVDRNGLMTCSNLDETRTLSVAPKEGGCELIYEKNGKLNVPAYSAHGTEHCFNARETVRKRLVGQGWKCSL